MQKTITKLTNEQTNTMVSDFLTRLGKRLEFKRKQHNLSQTELADCLEIDRTTLSKYENGTRDMQISMLPLFSTYCKFPIYELFPRDESQAILDMFASAVSVTVERKVRQEKKKADQLITPFTSKKSLKGQVYEVDGVEVFEPAKHREAAPKSQKAKYKDAEMNTDYKPCTDEEFCDYVRMHDNEEIDRFLTAGEFLKQLQEAPSKDSLKGAIADYIIDGLVVSEMSKPFQDPIVQRVYAYYKAMYQQIKVQEQGNFVEVVSQNDFGE